MILSIFLFEKLAIIYQDAAEKSTFQFQTARTELLRHCIISSNVLSTFPADPLVGSIATQYLTNRAEHDRIARQWTKRYAT